MYILIIVFGYYGGHSAISSAEFYNQGSCILAKETLDKKFKGSIIYCLKK